MIPRHLLTGLIGMIAVAALVVGVGSAAGSTARSGAAAVSVAASFTDPVGDAAGAADITAVSVANATGTITLTATATGVSTIDGASEPDLHFFIDSDKSTATGQSGMDYDVYYWRSATDWGWDVEHYNGAKWVEVNSQTLSFSRSGDTLTWKLNAADLGGTTGFNFVVGTGTWANNEMTASDRAPDAGLWTYDLSGAPAPTPTPTPTPTVKLVIGVPTIVPARAVAGSRLVVTFPVIRSDTGLAVTNGTMICDPSVQGKVIAHAESFKNGTARLAFTIPKTAKGKVLKVKVTIKAGTLAATRIATFKIR